MRYQLGIISLAAAVVVGAFAALPQAIARPPALDAITQPVKDGCQRSPVGLLLGTSPEWVHVHNTPARDPLPSARWVGGAVSSYDPAAAAAHPSGGDLPTSHDAYDFLVNISPDSQYRYLLGGSAASRTGNYAGKGEETARLHTEWEDMTLPQFAWPQPGDRVLERGSWVWDCGHWGSTVSVFDPSYPARCGDGRLGSPSCRLTGERTEFHPYRVLWDQRGTSPRGPYGESQAELFISTDQTPAGRIADCAHAHPAPAGSQSYGLGYVRCLRSGHDWQGVSGHYSFFLPAPPRPNARARLHFRAIDHGSIGAPRPKLIAQRGGIRVVLDLHARRDRRMVVAYTFFVGWTRVPATDLPTHLRVRLDRLVVHRAMDPGCIGGVPFPACSGESNNPNQLTTAPGEWDLYVDANGIWRSWAPGSGEFQPVDGQTFPGTQTIDLYVPRGQVWTLYVQGRECDLGGLRPAHPMADCPTDRHEIATDNDVPGQIVDTYPSAAASVGTHTSNGQTAAEDPSSTCPASNLQGCYTLTYTVTVVRDLAVRARARRK